MSGLVLTRTRVLAALVIGGACLLASDAWGQAAVLTDAQGYKYLAPYVAGDPAKDSKEKVRSETLKNINNAVTQIRAVLDGGRPLADSRANFDYYYTRMLFPKLTLTTDEALKDLPKEREGLVRDLVRCADPAVHRHLVNNLVLPQMKEIAQNNYHPACRYNAMLTISGLNSVEPVAVGADKKTPEPLIDALPFILEQFTKADSNDAIRVAALLGLVRHLEWDNFRGPVGAPAPAIAPPQRDAIVKQLLALALAKEPPAGRDAAGHEWFRRRAIDGLMHASYYQVDPAVGSALETLVKDDSESLAIRCAAALAMGKVVYRAPAKLEPVPTAKELGYLALVACDKELTRVTNLNKAELDRLLRMGGAGGSYGGSGGYPGGDEAGIGGGMRGATPGGSGTMGGRGRGRSGSSGYPGSGSSGPGSMSSSSRGYPGSSGSSDAAEGGYGYTAAPADPKQYRFDLVRRRLRSQLYAVEVGLGGPDVNTARGPKPGEAPAAPTGPPRGVEALAKGTPDETAVTDISKLVAKLVEAVESTDNTDLAALEKDLRKQMKPLEAKTRKLAAPTATPADVPADVPALPSAAPARPAAAASAAGEPPAGAPAPAAGARAPQRGPATPPGSSVPPAAGTPAPPPAAGTPAPAPAPPVVAPPASAPPAPAP